MRKARDRARGCSRAPPGDPVPRGGTGQVRTGHGERDESGQLGHKDARVLQLRCPYCGPRNYTEFTYGGQANLRRPPEPDALSDEEWCAYVYFRDNPRGEHDELWLHSSGCRRWITVRRNTHTHDVGASSLPGAPQPK
jgi:heterotetrameric sarcosine oxidase delta subunit